MNESDDRKRNWSVGWVVGIVVAVAALVAVGFVVTVVLIESDQEIPEFPSLVDDPDLSLQGTFAYTDAGTGCVRIIAASGSASKDVYCPEPWSVDEAAKLGKPIGPQLVWLEDGRLEATWFRMVGPPDKGLRPGWQVVIDVRSGEVEELTRDSAPSEPNLDTRPQISPDGSEITSESDSLNGRIDVSIVQPDGESKTLLSAQGPGKYMYGVRGTLWSPDYEWIVVDDGRILIVTLGEPALVRVLVDSLGGGLDGNDPRESSFALTAENYL